MAIADIALLIARSMGDRASMARSLRAKANALYVSGANKAAVAHHIKAQSIFRALHDNTELARTLSASIQPLLLLGRYRQALAAAKQARRIFSQLRDTWRMARVDLNAGNIYHRQDRFVEALMLYERAYRQLLPLAEKDPEAVAVALHNIAMCLVGMNDFHRALNTHERAREFARQHNMPLLAAQADYNIAGLFYLRGEYSRAIAILRSTRQTFEQANDQYHFALCHLDLSEIYLELNLTKAATEMAEMASVRFQNLAMGYESGKSLVNLAIALSQQGRTTRALELFAEARRMLRREANPVWPSLIDLYRAMVLTDQGCYPQAQRLCSSALRAFRSAGIPAKLIFCRLLLARLHFRAGRGRRALSNCRLALRHLRSVDLPAYRCQALSLMAQTFARENNLAEAHRHFLQAKRALESLRGNLQGEDLKISFLKNKLEIYEGLVEVRLRSGTAEGTAEAFDYIEQGKSRSLRDLVTQAGSGLPLALNPQDKSIPKLRDLRAQLNWYAHLEQVEQLRAKKASRQRLQLIRGKARRCEELLLRLLREMPAAGAEIAGFSTGKPANLDEIRDGLSEDQTLLEFFQIRDQFVVAILTRNKLDILPAGNVPRVIGLIEHFQFQLSKFRLDAEYIETFQHSLLETTQAHLKALHDELLKPVRDQLHGNHVIFAPHGVLHALPFQALFDGDRYLADSFRISYAPSATIYSLCRKRPVNDRGPALIFGIPDPLAPLISDEVKAVAAALPQSELFLGKNATDAVLRQKGAECRLIHIATHGYFRQDNPMFSGIMLGDALLTLYDLYQLKLPAELITLSGCATGLNVVAGGDELLGLVRGLIYAGAGAALLTLWDVHDQSTLDFMTSFYTCLAHGQDKASALQQASRQVRKRYPHPYYWAPFTLVGNVSVVT